jgi:integrase
MPRSLGVRQLRSRRCGCEKCRQTYPLPERRPTRDCSGSWQARYTDETGKRIPVTRKKKDDAVKARNAAVAAIDAGTYKDPKRGQIKLAAWREKWLEGRSVENTTSANGVSIWNAHIGPRWGDKPLRAIHHQDVQNWITELKNSGLARQTVIGILSSLSTMLDAARRDSGRVEVNPCNDVTIPEDKGRAREQARAQEKPPTIEQVQLVAARIALVGAHRRPDIYSRIPLLILETGLRWGELAGLMPDCVDLDAGELTVRRVVEQVKAVRRLRDYPKSEAGFRIVPLTVAARTLLRQQMELQPGDDDEPVFRAPRGGLLNRSNFHDQIWLPSTIAAGVHACYERPSGQKEHWPTPHDVRHAYASRLENGGVPESVRKEVLGHERPKSQDVTWLYTHAPEESRWMILAALGDEAEQPVKPIVRALRLVG